MGDLVRTNQDMPDPTVEVRRLWLDDQIAEKKWLAARLKADAERILQGQLKKLQADIIMLDRKIVKLQSEKDLLDKYGSQEVIDINVLNKKGE